jgi:hypothetical protein
VRAGRYRFERFAPIETPYASHASAVHVTAVVKEWHASVQLDGIESRGPLRLASVETRQSAYVEGVGLVWLRITDGRPADAATKPPTFEIWLKEALVQGQPYP